MSLPFNLQKLPPECLDMIRYMARRGTPATTADMEADSGMSARLIGKAIRRLVNGDYIDVKGGIYNLTDDGHMAADLIAEHDRDGGNKTVQTSDAVRTARKLAIVGPRTYRPGVSNTFTVIANPPDSTTSSSPTSATEVVLRLNATGGSLDTSTVTLQVPPNAASLPAKFNVTPAPGTPGVRIRVDAYQHLDLDRVEKLDAIYFDAPVARDTGSVPDSTNAPNTGLRAVGMEVLLVQG